MLIMIQAPILWHIMGREYVFDVKLTCSSWDMSLMIIFWCFVKTDFFICAFFVAFFNNTKSMNVCRWKLLFLRHVFYLPRLMLRENCVLKFYDNSVPWKLLQIYSNKQNFPCKLNRIKSMCCGPCWISRNNLKSQEAIGEQKKSQ